MTHLEQINKILLDPKYQPFLAVLKSARNGLVYGAKIRFPHALVISILFQQGRPLKERALYIFLTTREHSWGLCRLAAIYKLALLVLGRGLGRKEGPVEVFIASFMASWIVVNKRTAVNEQIVLYFVSRFTAAMLPRAPPKLPASVPAIAPSRAKVVAAPTTAPPKPPAAYPHPPGWPYPKSLAPDPLAYRVFAASLWGVTMFLFAKRRERLHGGMVSGLQYIYLDSEVWDSLKTFLWRGWTVGRSPSTFTHFPPTNLLYRQQALIPVPFEAMRAGSGLVWDEIHI